MTFEGGGDRLYRLKVGVNDWEVVRESGGRTGTAKDGEVELVGGDESVEDDLAERARSTGDDDVLEFLRHVDGVVGVGESSREVNGGV